MRIGVQGVGSRFRVSSRSRGKLEDQMKNDIEHEMEAGIMLGMLSLNPKPIW